MDFHAETTSEKLALANYLDGQVTAVWGTHTHVQTNDARLLPRGTAYLTDAGMTGARDSVLGVETEGVVERYLSGRPQPFAVAQGPAILNGLLLEFDSAGRAHKIQTVNRELGLV
ncbi:MAG: YmdB family metallophosphoesterase [Clostridium sp.]|nr:YmdB family metallophosphoesterase [Clostridium sp.]